MTGSFLSLSPQFYTAPYRASKAQRVQSAPLGSASDKGSHMAKLVRIVIQLPLDLKTRLDGLKQQGYTTSGFIRAMLERELAKIDDQSPEQKSLTLVPTIKRANSR